MAPKGAHSWEAHSPSHVTRLHPHALRRALSLARPATHKDSLQPNLSVVNISAGRLRTGRPEAAIIVADPLLAETTLGIDAADVEALSWVLSRLHPDRTELIDTQDQQIVRDDVIALIIDKPGHGGRPGISPNYWLWYVDPTSWYSMTGFFRSGPCLLLRDQNFALGVVGSASRCFPVDHLLKEEAAEWILANRHDLIDALSKLAVARIDPDLLVQFVLKGRGGDAALTLTTVDRSGKKSRAIMRVSRRCPIETSFDFPDLDFVVRLAPMLETVKFIETANVLFEPLPKFLRLVNSNEDSQAYAIFAHVRNPVGRPPNRA
jgi:hypothetical protein